MRAHVVEPFVSDNATAMCGRQLGTGAYIVSFRTTREMIGVGQFGMLCPYCIKSARYEAMVRDDRGPLLPPVDRIPESNVSGIAVTGIYVVEWHDTPEPTGRPVAVALLLSMPSVLPEGGRAVMRLKSAAVTDELVAALIRHRNGVWPDVPNSHRSRDA